MQYVQIIFEPVYGDHNFKGDFKKSNKRGWHVKEIFINQFVSEYEPIDKEERSSWVRIKKNAVSIFDDIHLKSPISIKKGDYVSTKIAKLSQRLLAEEYIGIMKTAKYNFIDYIEDNFSSLNENERKVKMNWEFNEMFVSQI